MKHALYVFVSLACFAAGVIVYDVRNPNTAEASGGSNSGFTLGQNIGNAVAGNFGVTGTLGVSGQTTLAGLAATSAVIGGAVGLTGTLGVSGAVALSGALTSSAAISCSTAGTSILGTATTGGGAIGVRGVAAASLATAMAADASASGAGYALKVITDATSPTYGAMQMTVQDTNPTSCSIGDLFMFTGGVLRVCTATNTWTNVGAQ